MLEELVARYLVPISVTAGVAVALLLVRWISLRLLSRWDTRTESPIDDIVVAALRRPSVLWCLGATLPGVCLAEAFTKICLPSGSALPLETAAAELAARSGATVVHSQGTCSPDPGQLILALGEGIRVYPAAAALLPQDGGGREWELVKRTGDNLVIAGSSPRNVCHAALAWIENPLRETDRVSTYDFSERFTMWDNALNQFYRFSRKFDRRQHIREIARLGHTGIEVNRYADAGGYWVRVTLGGRIKARTEYSAWRKARGSRASSGA